MPDIIFFLIDPVEIVISLCILYILITPLTVSISFGVIVPMVVSFPWE